MTLLHETGSHIRWKEVRELVVGEQDVGLPQGWAGMLVCCVAWLSPETCLPQSLSQKGEPWTWGG